MKPEQVARLLEDIEKLLKKKEEHLSDILIKELLVNVVKLQSYDLDTLDLKIMNRALRELRYAFKVFKPYRHIQKVSIFGSARTPEDHPYYKMAVSFARQLAEAGFMVITGAADGIMRAGNEGAGAGKSFGVNIHLPSEQGPNEFIVDDPKLITFKYFFTRKLLFVMESDAIALFPGGFGTHDEGFETLTLIQTGKASPRPLLLLDLPGEGYWEGWDRFIREQILARGLISPEDTSLYSIAYSPEEAVREISHFYSTYHSTRQVHDKLVVRLERGLSDEGIAELNKEFGDLLVSGRIERTDPLPDEMNEPELADLPRLVFAYNHKSMGRLTQLIQRINALGAAGADSTA